MTKRITQKYINEAVRKSTVIAYNEGIHRNLNFLAVAPVSVDTAVKIMTEALDIQNEEVKGYNDFSPSLLRKLLPETQIYLGRELSVCIYVKGNVPNTVNANEYNFYPSRHGLYNVTRLWWD